MSIVLAGLAAQAGDRAAADTAGDRLRADHGRGGPAADALRRPAGCRPRSADMIVTGVPAAGRVEAIRRAAAAEREALQPARAGLEHELARRRARRRPSPRRAGSRQSPIRTTTRSPGAPASVVCRFPARSVHTSTHVGRRRDVLAVDDAADRVRVAAERVPDGHRELRVGRHVERAELAQRGRDERPGPAAVGADARARRRACGRSTAARSRVGAGDVVDHDAIVRPGG